MRALNLVKKYKERPPQKFLTGLPRFDSRYYGIVKGMNYNIGASMGVGKTTFSLHIILNGLITNPNVRLFYFSLEMSYEVVLAKIISWTLFKYKNIQCPVAVIMNFADRPFTYYKELIELNPTIEDIMSRITIIDDISPNGYLAYMTAVMKNYGVFSEKDGLHSYTYNDDKTHIVTLIDHVGLLTLDSGNDERTNIERLAKHTITLRNVCSITNITIQQLNRNLNSNDSAKQRGDDITPTSNDFLGSDALNRSAENIYTLYRPDFKKNTQHFKYDIRRLKHHYVCLSILKCRYGIPDAHVPLLSIGASGFYHELPKVEDITEEYYSNVEQNIT